ncbi:MULTISPECIES: class I SAM-dependent methyltransferase [Desulfococcus]|uniref:Type 11 methyltransferase n=1 Tax=Desulfococcus multivorans DSM 2059 TaxID=1121405 RepID=S7U0G7_DESML|nr:class I SAM-dependent methyltransferase [Desulfococcus multivorans]AOY58797.1 methyltransferase, type 12 [Desulfococcus multivorans]AQV01080.1 SAM-dependent methyltransferase [Desulfococcus multivorans]EPR42921.1 type 11 methyltransferase [Desulfococcus multivorans DSM 2059]SJZ50459.1 Ubiquinone/menaquinone biosynthesis C-methylase UbiE [Desulfococcus multivorans DSM 2059]
MNRAIRINEQRHARRRDAFIEALVGAANGYFKIYSIYLGHRLGLYRGLADLEALTSGELAARTGTHERYVREWLEQQAVAGILEVADETAPTLERRYRLPSGHAEVLIDRESVNYLAPLAQAAVGVARPLEALEAAFRSGGGVPFAEYGEELRRGVGELNRPLFLYQLGREYLPSIPDIHRRLLADPPARVADMGCGTGWSAIGMAQSYPGIHVDGFDVDAASITDARDNARNAGLDHRVRFEVRDAGDPDLTGAYDLVTAFECVHDMSDPVAGLTTMRRLAGSRGSVIVMDERTGERFTTADNPIEQFLYGFSVMGCLPSAMAEQPSAATGTLMRPDTLRQYARQAGFRDIEILPVENDFFRFYRLNV